MAKKHQVNIDVKTRATGNGAQLTEQSLDDAKQSAAELRQMLDKIDGIDPSARAQVEKLADSLERVEKTGRRASEATKKGAKSTRNGGLAFLEFSRAVEDAQYGMRGVLNNIPQMILLMGGTGGLAGAISIAAVSLSLLVSHMGSMGKVTQETEEKIDEAAQRLKELNAEIAGADFQTYLNKLESIQQGLDRENQALANNISLLQQKRKAELELAAVNDEIELAQIAQRELTDPTFTSSDSVAARGTIERRKLSRGQSALETEKQAEIEASLDRRGLALKELAATEGRLARLSREREESERELNELRLAQTASALLIEKAEKLEKKAGFFSQGDKDLGLINRQAARENFPASDQARLEELSGTIVPGQRSEIESSRKQIEDVRNKITELGSDVDAIRKSATAAQESAQKLTEAKIVLSEIKETNSLAVSTNAEISKGVSDLETQARSISAENEQAAQTIRSANATLTQATSDGLIDATEYQRIARDLAEVQRQNSAANIDLMTTIRTLQSEVATLRRESAEIRAGAVNATNNGGL